MANVLSIVYEQKRFFGGSEQTRDYAYNPTKDDVRRAFHYLKRFPMTTAVWFEDKETGVSSCYFFESTTDAERLVVTRKQYEENSKGCETSRGSFLSARRVVYNAI